MHTIRKFILMLCLISATTLNMQAQTPDVMTQKINFRKALVTIDEILKELIYTKKINLSYSPDDLNLNETINLPSKEIMIGDLLKLISNKTGNKLIVKGQQIIIKKDRKVLPQQKIQTEVASIKKTVKDTFVVRENIIAPLIPRTSLIARDDSSRSKLVSIPMLTPHRQTTSLGTEDPEKTDFPAQIKEVKNSQVTAKLNNKVMFGATAGIGSSFLTNLGDTGQNLKTKAALAWNLQTNILFKPGEKWLLETGIGLNHSNYSVTSHFNWPVVDSLSYDTISSLNIKLKINNLEIPVMVNYYIKLKKNNIITGVGGSIQYALDGKREYTNSLRTVSKKVEWNSPSGEITLQNSLLNLNRINYCLLGQLGYQQERWKIVAVTRLGLNSFTKRESGRLLQFSLSYTYMFLP